MGVFHPIAYSFVQRFHRKAAAVVHIV